MDTSVTPEELAHRLVEAGDIDWIRGLVDALDHEIRTEPLELMISLWDLPASGAARLFGVSRQAFSKWLQNGPPADRADDIAAVHDITTLLDRYVKRERIAAVVRRRSENLGGRSIIEALEAGDYEETVEVMRAAFDLRRIQP